MTPPPLLLKPRQAQKVLGVGKTRLYELLKSGELVSIKPSPKTRLIPYSACEDWVKAQLAKNT